MSVFPLYFDALVFLKSAISSIICNVFTLTENIKIASFCKELTIVLNLLVDLIFQTMNSVI